MTQNLSAITFFVDDYDSAIEYFTTVCLLYTSDAADE